MYRIISASKDTYITNKIVNNKFRATDANLGQAGTLDLFKLYAENISGSDKTPRKVSDPGRTHLRAAEAPSAQIGRRQDLEMATPEVLAKSASQNVVALKNRMGHQVDADGELR